MTTFPRQYARTQRLSLGEPRGFRISPDGLRVAFVQSPTAEDPLHLLHVMNVATGEISVAADPREFPDDVALPPEEQARRERAREGGAGIVSFATDRDVTMAVFTVGGSLYVTDLDEGVPHRVEVPEPIFDPQPSPDGSRIAYVHHDQLWCTDRNGVTTSLIGQDSMQWGTAEFVAAEEMGRDRGHWWSPDGKRIAVAGHNDASILGWWIGDPADPAAQPRLHRYPAAGTANSELSVAVVDQQGSRVDVTWDHDRFEYVAHVGWRSDTELALVLQSRDQRTVQLVLSNVLDGSTTVVFEDQDDQWVELVPNGWGWLADGSLVCCADREDARRLMVAASPVTSTELQVRSIITIGADSVVFMANRRAESSETHLFRWTAASGVEPLTHSPGVHSGAAAGPTVVVRRSTLETDRAEFSVLGGPTIESHAATALVHPNVRLLQLGPRRLQSALLLPHGTSEDARLPVLLDPYGGPHALRAVASRSAYWVSQWFADQGFAVLIVDGRGTPGRGAEWERSISRDLAGPVMEDQLDALHAAAELEPRMDLGRVGVRGWSFGGYLAALLALHHPESIHAAVAGAPVTEWRLYDTHYTERYLGHPDVDPAPYDRTSLLGHAALLERPLMLIHGLADDNVVAAHTLQFSSALLAGGRQHNVLPLVGVSHMTPQEVVAENLLLLQLQFLQEHLHL